MSKLFRFISFFAPFLISIILWLVNLISFSTLILGYLIYCAYSSYTSKTELKYHKTDKNLEIINNCKILREAKFKPHFLLPSPFLQIILANHVLGPKEELKITRKEVNGFGTYLDHVEFDIEKIKIKNKSKKINFDFSNNTKDNPVLLVIPGLTGSKNDKYVMNLCFEGLLNKYNVFIYQNRLLSEHIVLPTDSHLNLIDDMDTAIDLLKQEYTNSKIFAIGCSYGALKLMNYLGTKNYKNKKIEAAVSICNPYDMSICQKKLAESIYDEFILALLKKNLEKNYQRISNNYDFYEFEIEKARKSKTLVEFDECMTRRVLGFKSAEDYYTGFSCVQHIEKINVPLLCVNSIDDNITTSKAIPFDQVKLNENIFHLTTDKGGHLCYIGNEKLFGLKQWVNKPVLDFINAARFLS